MNREKEETISTMLGVAGEITEALRPYYPKAVVLFGSLARHLEKGADEGTPKDVDLLIVGHYLPTRVVAEEYPVTVEFQFFRPYQIVAIAKSLRYDSRPVALSKLYSKTIMKSHARDVIAASILLGPGYTDFGIEQIEVEAVPDTRDYSVHRVLLGEQWWERLCAYARERRGPLKRFSDRLAKIDEFETE